MDERGWTYGYLERESHKRARDGLSRSRWQQLGTGFRMTEFPEPATLQLIADVIEADITTVLLAAAQSVGLDARRRGPLLGHLLPAGTDVLSHRMRDAILTIIRAAVAETLAAESDDDENDHGTDMSLEWANTEPSTRRNTKGRSADTSA